ncbi:capsule polysaccharide synthase Cps1 [Cladophialophora carrionii]|uniref:Capsule polysaccharide synthase Cps1 n=1 Tax=Cladophialophora carrionii TaxID=86049 RepID=A0A1C1C9A1_9EURO|nr:capsule polysaccharide synthase Cps1 [Cladophialophora carrionii]
METQLAIFQPFRSTLSLIVRHPNLLFISLFVFRYLRFVVHVFSYFRYRPSTLSKHPRLKRKDCTVVIPTCCPEAPAFSHCIASIVQNSPKVIHIVAVGKEQEKQAWSTIAPFISGYPYIHFKVSHSDEANKRRQVALAIASITTHITILCDDHVVWASPRFLRAALAPFEEDRRVGGVGTRKHVIRHSGIGLFRGFWNVMGALYLERHNFEHRASNAIDGGVAVISGRTCLYRTTILQDPALLAGYLNETFFFGLLGPLNADDDNYLTRALVKRNWKIKFQDTSDALILCDVGVYPKFLKQCLRWARTTFRSNLCSLITDRSVYQAQPWSVYALMISQMVNFALFYDGAMVWTLTRTGFYSGSVLKALCVWVLASKLPKLLPYFWRHPRDLIYLPTYYLFAYFHSLIKLWALLTFWDVQWSGRDLASINQAAMGEKAAQGPRVIPEAEYVNFSDDPTKHNTTTMPPRTPTRPITQPTNRQQRSTPQPIGTPWAFVQPVNLHRTPANVLQNQLAGRSWPALWSVRERHAYQDQGYHGDHSPVALQFEENLATRSLTPKSSSNKRKRTETTSFTNQTPHPLPLTPPDSPPPFRSLSTPSRMPETPTRSFVRADQCGRLHEGYYPRRICKL